MPAAKSHFADKTPQRLGWALAVCVLAAAVELMGGRLTGSVALTVDGLHSLAHVVAIGIALAGALAQTALSRRGERASDMAGVVNACLIGLMAVFLLVESLERLRRPDVVSYGNAAALALFGLVTSGVAALLIGHDRGRTDPDLNRRAILMHLMGDVGVGVLALAGLTVGLLTHWTRSDALTGMIGAGLLAWLAASLLSSGLRSLKRTA